MIAHATPRRSTYPALILFALAYLGVLAVTFAPADLRAALSAPANGAFHVQLRP